MNRYSLYSALGFGLCLGVACSSSSDPHAPAVSDGGASSQSGSGAGGRKPVGTSGGAGTEFGGSAGELSEGGSAGAAAGEGGEGGLEQGMIIPVSPGACSEDSAWASSTPLPGISTAASERLLSITADELDILFLRDGALLTAHRDLARAEFGAAAAVSVAEGFAVDGGAALSTDGKTMVLIAMDGQSFAAFTRPSRTGTFDATPDTTSFTGINQRALQTMQHYAAPGLAPNGKTFVFSGFTPEPEAGFPSGVEGVSVVYESAWTGAGWAMPESISQDLFDGTSSDRALPSGLSSDSRTLFYFDEGSGKQLARFRDRPDAPLYTVVDLGARDGAAPDARCDRLYYSSDGDVLVAE